MRRKKSLAVLVVGIGPLARLTGAQLHEHDGARRLIGHLRFAEEALHARLRAPVIGTFEDLEATLRQRVVDEVYFASMAREHVAPIQAGIRTCETLGVPFALPLCPYRLGRARPKLRQRGLEDGYLHYQLVRVRPVQSVVKRLIDVAVSAGALLLLAPLLLVAATLLTLTSPGSVLFRQERVGRHGRIFELLKFRSMVHDADRVKERLAGEDEPGRPVFKMKRDPRVTRLGRIMRRYSIDDLPQLVNVLRGEMSLMGPRAPTSEQVERYDAWQRRRLSVRPGLTCPWHLGGVGANEVSRDDGVLLDLRYIDHWSLGLELSLVWKAMPAVLMGRGAS